MATSLRSSANCLVVVEGVVVEGVVEGVVWEVEGEGVLGLEVG